MREGSNTVVVGRCDQLQREYAVLILSLIHI